MESLLIPKHQPNFPHEDVNDTNRDLFQQLLLEPSYIESAHELAEQYVLAYKMGHQTLKSLSLALNMDYIQIHSFSLGATVYESLATTIKPVIPEVSIAPLLHSKLTDISILSADPFNAAMAMRDQELQLTEEAPNVSHLISFASQLQPHLNEQYVRMGAALEWNIDRDIVQ